jgi:hypothetical protein
MTPFEAGFVKFALESGMSADEASQLYGRSMEHPGMAVDPFKRLGAEQQDTSHTPNTLANLAAMFKQHVIDTNFAGERYQAPL